MASMCAHSALQFLGNGAHPLTLLGLPADPEPAALWPPASWAASWFFFLLKSAKSIEFKYFVNVRLERQLCNTGLKCCVCMEKSYFLNRNIWGSPCCPERGSWGHTGTGRQDTHCCFRQWIHWTRCVSSSKRRKMGRILSKYNYI